MKTFFKFLLIPITTCSMSLAIAAEVHTWHHVTAAQGTWSASLQMINQGGSFVLRDGSKINNFEIDADHPQDYGFMFDEGDNFDVAYTLTLTEKASKSMFQSKACVFVITAKAPAKPDVTPLSYHGAKCEWKIVPGVGEDYMVA